MTTWLQHVKAVHASGSTSFKESLKRASASWKKTKGKASTGAKKKKKVGKKQKKEAEAQISTEEPAEIPKKKKRKRRVKKTSPSLSDANFKNIDSHSLR